MNDKRQFYESPVTDVIVLEMECGLLDGSITAERKGYGTAQTEEWN